jgi:hypothetical protein
MTCGRRFAKDSRDSGGPACAHRSSGNSRSPSRFIRLMAAINVNFIPGLSGSFGVSLTPDGKILYVTNAATGTVGEYNAIIGSTINACLITGLGTHLGIYAGLAGPPPWRLLGYSQRRSKPHLGHHLRLLVRSFRRRFPNCRGKMDPTPIFSATFGAIVFLWFARDMSWLRAQSACSGHRFSRPRPSDPWE